MKNFDRQPGTNLDFMIRMLHKPLFYFLVFVFVILVSCDKFDGEQEVPSYISIDTIGFSSIYSDEGTDKQRITDAWVYVNDQLVGGFEMPFTAPVLNRGEVKLEIRPGIILNGISETRAPYPYFAPIIINDFSLEQGEVAGINDLNTVYRDNTEFVWREEFEDEAFAIVKGPEGEVDIARTSPPGSPEAFTDENSEYSGVAVLGSDNSRMVLQSDDGNDGGFELRKGNFIFLELHYKTEVPLITGLFINQQNQFIQKRPFVGLNPTDEWKKVYINFTPLVNEEVGAVDFRFYFEANASEGQAGSKIYLDNIKLLSRQNLKLSDE